MSPIQKLTACTWPNCENAPSGAWCSRCRKRVQRLGLPTGTDQLPDEETLSHLEDMWASRPVLTQSAAMAPGDLGDPLCVVARMVGADPDGSEADILKAVGSMAGALAACRDMLGDHPDRELRDLSEILDGEGFLIPLCSRSPNCTSLHLRQRLHTLLDERSKARRDLADARAVLGPRFSGTTESLVGDIQALLAYVRIVEEEGGRYALLCQQAHDELDRAGARSINNMGEGAPAERIRLLVADHDTAMGHRIAERDQSRLEKFELVSKVDHLQREVHFLQHPPVPPSNYVQTQPKHHPWLDEVTAGSLVLTARDVKIAQLSIDALADDTTDPLFVARVLRVALSLDEVPRG